MISKEKENTTLSINKTIKKEFRIECLRNDVEMSETVEVMMSDYTEASKKMHKLNLDGRK